MISRREASVNDRLRARKHFLLFGALLLTLVTQPLVAREPTAARIAYDLLIAGAALCVFFIVFGLRWERRLALVLMLPTIALTIAEYVLPQRHFVATAVAYHFSVSLFLAFAITVIVRDVFRNRAVQLDDVVGAFCGYLLLGILWGNFYVVVELLAPGSFSVNADIRWQLEDWHLRRALFNYFSLAVMTSLGYGDITGVAPLANTLAWLEVLAAQFYLAVVISQLVGLKLAQALRRNDSERG